MICGTCQANASHILIKYTQEGEKIERCDQCSEMSRPNIYDVFLDRDGCNMNICDSKTGRQIPYWSKGQKTRIMRKLGIREVGDRVHGGR